MCLVLFSDLLIDPSPGLLVLVLAFLFDDNVCYLCLLESVGVRVGARASAAQLRLFRLCVFLN